MRLLILLLLISSCKKNQLFSSKVEQAILQGPKSTHSLFLGDLVKEKVKGLGETKVFKKKDSHLSAWVLYDQQNPILSKAEMTAWSKKFLTEKGKELGVSVSELKLVKEVSLTDKLYVKSYSRVINGKEVLNAYIDLIFNRLGADEFQLREIVNRAKGDQDIIEQEDKVDVLQTIAEFGEVKRYSHVYFSDKEKLRPSTKAEVVDKNGRIISLVVDDQTLNVYEAHDYNYHASSPLMVNIWARSPQNSVKKLKPIPLTNISGQGGVMKTDQDGFVQGAITGSIQLELNSDRFQLFDPSNNQRSLGITATTNESGVFEVQNQVHQRGMHIYTGLQEINRFARRFISPSEASYLSQTVSAYFNSSEQDAACNAYYNGQAVKIVFGLCSNPRNAESLGDYAEVIYHEWGHGLDDHVGRSKGITDRAFSEGIGDIIGGLYMNSPHVGPGTDGQEFNFNRSQENQSQAPYQGTDIYQEMQILKGAVWEMHQGLIQRYGEIKGRYWTNYLFYRHLLLADSYKESYEVILRLDDDDNNAMTRSPNHCLINRAFAKRNLTTLEQNCQDQVTQPTVPVDQSIFVELTDISGESAKLRVAANQADSVSVCSGSRKTCLSGSSQTLNLGFQLQGAKSSSSKKFFLSQSAVTLKEFDHFTIIVKQGGKVTGARTIKVVTK